MSPNPTRDVMSALQDLITGWMQEGSYTTNGLVDRLLSTHPDLAHAYVATHETVLLQEMIRRIIGRYRSERQRFKELAELISPEWQGRINPNLLHFPIDDDNVWQALPKMTKEECYYVADRYLQRAEPLLRRNQFFVTVGDAIELEQTVADVFTDEELADLWNTFVNPKDSEEPEGNAA